MPDAVGMIEIQGLSRGFLAANVAVQAASVTVDGIGFIQGGGVMVAIRGDVASVSAGLAAASASVPEAVVHTTSVLGRPDAHISGLLAEREAIRAGVRAFGGRGGVGGSWVVHQRQDQQPVKQEPKPRRRSRKATEEDEDG